MHKFLSPLSGQEVEKHRITSTICLSEIADVMGDWISTLPLLDEGDIVSLDPRTKAYLRTKVYECSKAGKRALIVPRPSADEDFDISHIANAVPVFIEDATQRAMLIPFREKAFKTLRNIVLSEKSPGSGIRLAVQISSTVPYPGQIHGSDKNIAHELGYCCQDKELALVFRWLSDQGFIRIEYESNQVFTTPEGYEQVGQMGEGLIEGVHEIFLVCRFANVDEAVMSSRFTPVERNISVAIKRISDHEHNQDINDEILLKIHSARIVIVDVDLHNFNVGFEAGYAYALNKEIIFTCQREISRDSPLPFDIATKNVIDCKDSDENFVNRLTNRIRLCLGG